MPNLTTIASYYAPVAKRPALVAALVGLGYPQRSLLSPLSCEVCDTTLSYAEALPCATEVATVQMGNGEYVTAAVHHLSNGGKVLAMGYHNPLCAGEVTWWGLGLGGECGCDWRPCPAE